MITGALAAALLVGVGLVLYPALSDLWNEHVQSRVVMSYVEATDGMDGAAKRDMIDAACAYNDWLAESGNRWRQTEEEASEYESLLNVTDAGVMGYIEIPKIDVKLPIYHGTSEAVLTSGVGHLEGSSLPVGGRGTHAVVSGHRGLPSARLFTDIDQLAIGDTFYVHVLDEVLAYEVDQILTVEPDDLSALAIDEDADLCTLVTCTPYGVNTHRLLVRGQRVALAEDAVEEAPPGIDPLLLAALAVGVVAVVAVSGAALWAHRQRKARAARAARHAAGHCSPEVSGEREFAHAKACKAHARRR